LLCLLLIVLRLCNVTVVAQQYYDSYSDVVYGTTTVSVNETAVPGGATYLRLKKVNLEIDFSTIRPKYVSFNFYDTTRQQNLRFNNSNLYIGALTSAPGSATPNATALFATGDKNKLNKAEFFIHDQTRYIDSIWVGGDDMGIDNICWDTVWHGSSASTIAASIGATIAASIIAMVLNL
jgi:hypothetical protein